MKTNIHMYTNQAGAALIVVLVMLIVLTMLGITGAKQTAMEERMAGNFRDQQIGFEVAEAALRVAEDTVLNPTVFNTFDDSDWIATGDSSDGLYAVDQALDPVTGTHTKKAVPAVKGASATNPEYYIERLPEIYMVKSSLVKGFPDQPPKIRNYRSTSRANGVTENTVTILQSTVYR